MDAENYLVIQRADHSGGSKSHRMNLKIFKDHGLDVKVLRLSSSLNVARNLVNSNQGLYLISVANDGSIKDLVKKKINKLIFSYKIGNLDNTIVDGAIPMTIHDIQNLRLLASVVRSTPKCFAWTSRPHNLIKFAEQLKVSSNIICASRSEAEIWKEKIGHSDKPSIQYLTPMNLDNATQSIDLGYSEPFLLLAVGNIGPRKGIQRYLDALERTGKHSTVVVMGEGEIANKARYRNIDLDLRYADINMCQPIKNAVRVFPSYSECFSRAQFEAVISGDPCLIAQSGSDPDINQFLDPHCVCGSVEELVDKSVALLNDFSTLEKRDTQNAVNFYHKTQAAALRCFAQQ